jgi:serine/threonine protein kinase
MDLIKEAIISMNLKHKNLLESYGICLSDKNPKYIVLEYADMGDLLSLLRKHRTSKVVKIKFNNLFSFSIIYTLVS